MEPDPDLFLTAIAREIGSPHLLGDDLASGATPVMLARASEGLVQLALRRTALPSALRAIRKDQIAILRQLTDALGESVPETFERASPQGEADILAYDRLSAAFGASLRRGRGRIAQERLDAIVRSWCRTEADWRSAFEHARATALAVKQGMDLQWPDPAPEALAIYLAHRCPDLPPPVISDLRRLTGFNSKEIFFFSCRGAAFPPGEYVLRREPAYNVTWPDQSIAAEMELVNALAAAGLPVPETVVAEPTSEPFGGGFVITRRVAGAPRTPEMLGSGAEAMMGAVADLLAAIHQLPVPAVARYADRDEPLSALLAKRLDHYYRRWLNERHEDLPALEGAFQWLAARADRIEGRSGIVHGDFNHRNILFDGDRLSAILDWELSHIGHPAEDLAYLRPDVEAVMPWGPLLARYVAAGGVAPAPFALAYFEIWGLVWRLVISASLQGAYHRGEHRNFIFGSVAFAEYRELSAALAEALVRVSEA